MAFKKLSEVIDAQAPLPKRVTEEAKIVTQKAKQNFRGSVRAYLSKFYTDDEYENRRKRVMSTPLP